MATYDYLYFNLRLTSLEDEAETLRRAKTRAVGGLSLGGPARGDAHANVAPVTVAFRFGHLTPSRGGHLRGKLVSPCA